MKTKGKRGTDGKERREGKEIGGKIGHQNSHTPHEIRLAKD